MIIFLGLSKGLSPPFAGFVGHKYKSLANINKTFETGTAPLMLISVDNSEQFVEVPRHVHIA